MKGVMLSGLRAEMIAAVGELDRRASLVGLEVGVQSAYRSFAEQAQLYNQGRTAAEVRARTKKRGQGGAVTDAPPGESPHNWGLAVDIEEVNGHTEALMRIGASMGFGLVSWDPAHLEWPNLRGLVARSTAR